MKNKLFGGMQGELLMGIIGYSILVQIIVLIVSNNVLFDSIGLWIGSIVGMGMVIHMRYSIEDSLEFDAEHAQKSIRKSYATRMTVVAIILFAVAYFEWGNILTMLAGVMGLKVSAHVHPYLHKWKEKKDKR